MAGRGKGTDISVQEALLMAVGVTNREKGQDDIRAIGSVRGPEA